MGFFQKLFGGGGSAQPKRNEGIDEEHVILRRAIERCDSFKFAVDAGQMSVTEVVEKLQQNDFSTAIVKKAIAESFGDAAAEKYVK